MKLTLRRAAKLRNRVYEHLNELSGELRNGVQVQVNVYDPDVAEQVVEASVDLESTYRRYLLVSDLLKTIRNEIGAANARAGVNELLAEEASLRGQISVLSSVAHTSIRPSDEQIVARVEGQNTAIKAGVGYGSSNTIILSTMTAGLQTDINDRIVTLTTEAEDIKDRLEAVNSTQYITLDDVSVETLRSEKLI